MSFVFFLAQISRLPFDWRNPIGYLSITIVQFIIVTHIFWLIASVLSLGIGFFILGITGAFLVKNCMQLFTEALMKKSAQSYVLKNITAFIDWQSILKELSKLNIDCIEWFEVNLF